MDDKDKLIDELLDIKSNKFKDYGKIVKDLANRNDINIVELVNLIERQFVTRGLDPEHSIDDLAAYVNWSIIFLSFKKGALDG